MSPRKKANFFIFLIIAIIAIISSSIAFSFTSELFPNLDINQNSQKLISIDDNGFTPEQIQMQVEKKEVSNNTTINITNITDNYTDDIIDFNNTYLENLTYE